MSSNLGPCQQRNDKKIRWFGEDIQNVEEYLCEVV